MTRKQYETIEIERHDKVVLVTLSREPALNALNKQLTDEVIDALSDYDQNPEIGCFVLTGKGKAFAAGADIKEMASKSYDQTFYENMFAKWDLFAGMRTPKIAAVNGFALGGGCELAMMCDIIFASENAKFGQPEINIGAIPGAGGTQRLTRSIGKSKAMLAVLTGDMISAQDAEKSGLVAKVLNNDDFDKSNPEFPGTSIDENFDYSEPEFLMFAGEDTDSELVGFAWLVKAPENSPPSGFTGSRC